MNNNVSNCSNEADLTMKQFLLASLVIVITVFIFNYEAVFGLDVLLLDDNARFINAIQNNHYPTFWKNLGVVAVLIKAMNFKLMLFGMDIARLFYLLVFMIPGSILIFYFNNKLLKINVVSALVSSIMVNILPYQMHIPKFLDGSYCVRGTFLLFISLIFLLKYLDSKKISFLIISILGWFVTNQNFAEQTIFIFPAIFFLIILRQSSIKNKIIALTVYSVIIFHKFYFIFTSDRGSAGHVTLQSKETMLYRFTKFIEWSAIDKLQSNNTIYFILGLLLLLFIVFFFISKNTKDNYNNWYIVIFYGVMAISTAFPFITVSKYFSTRYFYNSYLALWVLVIFLLYSVLYKFIKNRVLIGLVLIGFLIFTGINRHKNQIAENKRYNIRNAFICGNILKLGSLKGNSQIVFTGQQNGTGQYYNWSSGYMKYCTKRADVVGLLGNEYGFYNPFNIKHKGYSYKMEGLDLNKPIYVINFKSRELKKPEYLLSWLDENDNNSTWTVYALDSNTNLLKESYSGKGYSNYIHKTKEKNINLKDIQWGDPNSRYMKGKFDKM